MLWALGSHPKNLTHHDGVVPHPSHWAQTEGGGVVGLPVAHVVFWVIYGQENSGGHNTLHQELSN